MKTHARLALTAALIATASACSSTPSAPDPATTTTTTATTTVAPTTTTPPAAAPAPSDEDQVRDALTFLQNAYNNQDWAAYPQGLCPAQRAKFTGQAMELLKQTRANNGPNTMAVLGVAVNGDQAVATVNASTGVGAARQVDMHFERGADGWKVCMNG